MSSQAGLQEIIAGHNLKATHEIIAAISTSKRALEKILENQTDLFCLFADSGEILLGNRSFASYYGSGSDLLMRETLKDLFSPDGWQIFRNKIEILKKHREKRNVSFELLMDGDRIHRRFHENLDILWTISIFESVSDRRGTIFSLVGRDMTELKRFQKRLSMIFSSVPLAIFHINKEHKVVGPYSAYTEVLFGEENPDGKDLKILLGSGFTRMSAHQRSGVDYLLESIGEEELWYDIYKPHFPREIQVKDGPNELWVEFSYSPVVRDHRVEEILVVAGDITDRIRTRRLKENHVEDDGKFSAIFSEVKLADPKLLRLSLYDFDHQLGLISELLEQEGKSLSDILPPLKALKGVALSCGLNYLASIVNSVEVEIAIAWREVTDKDALKGVTLAYYQEIKATWEMVNQIVKAVHSEFSPQAQAVKPEIVVLAQNALRQMRDQQQTPEERLATAEQLIENLVSHLGTSPERELLIDVKEIENRLRSFGVKTLETSGKLANLYVDIDHAFVSKSVFGRLSEMAIHLVTNAIHHGIEEPAARKGMKKSETGAIRILIKKLSPDLLKFSVEDDGAGIDPRHIVEQAITLRMLSRDEGERIVEDRNAVYPILLKAGFSTVSADPSATGRGLGLEVAQRIALQLSPTDEGFHIKSAPGFGSMFATQVSLTQSKVPSLKKVG